MKRAAVNFPSARSIGYDAAPGELDIEFHSGAVYRYFDVPRRVFDTICAADSVGRFINAHVRGDYRFRRL